MRADTLEGPVHGILEPAVADAQQQLARGLALSDPESREIVYGMPYDEWRAKYQKEASAEQQAAFAAAQKH